MRRLVTGALAGACVLAVGGGAASVAVARSSAGTHPALPPLRLVAPSVSAGAGLQPWQRPLQLAVPGGSVVTAQVTANGAPVAGTIANGTWMSTQRLVPSTSYAAVVTARRDGDGEAMQLQTQVRTTRAKHQLHAVLSPGSGSLVGVGEPVVVTFDRPVPARAQRAVARRLSVTSSPHQRGGWYWLSPTELHWRPVHYWRPHTRVTATMNLARLYLGHGVWGAAAHRHSSFRIGNAHVSLVDAATHRMTVRSNGQVVRVLPVSTGRAQYPTHGGIHITLGKAQVVTMDSATVGIPRDSPDGYYEKVYWDVRITNSGEFVHAAPWSERSQGFANVSHGCVNVSTANAEWFYGFALPGDIVEVVNTGAAPELGDAGTADWNRSPRSLHR